MARISSDPWRTTGSMPKIDRWMAEQPFIAAPDAATSSRTIDASVMPRPAAAVLLGDGDADPTPFGHRPVEVPRELVVLVVVPPVGVVEAGAHGAHALADQLVIGVRQEVHALRLPRLAFARHVVDVTDVTPEMLVAPRPVD